MVTMQKPTITVIKPPKSLQRCQHCPPGIACLWVCAPGIDTEAITRSLSTVFTGITFVSAESCPQYDVCIGEPDASTLEIWDYVG
jgi:hypothetical protein